MWDIFNKETVKELRTTVKDLESKLSSKERELQKLDTQLTKQISKTTSLTKLLEEREKALDAVLTEMKNFFIQNKSKNLDYDSLNVTKNILDGITNVNEYAIDLDIDLRNVSARRVQRHFINFIYSLNNKMIISSYNIKIDHAFRVNNRDENYSAFVLLYSEDQISTIENLLINLLHRLRVVIEDHKIKDERILKVSGNIRESYY